MAAGHGLGFWSSAPGTTETQSDLFEPKMSAAEAAEVIAGWQKAVKWVNTH
jgi:glycerol kinase